MIVNPVCGRCGTVQEQYFSGFTPICRKCYEPITNKVHDAGKFSLMGVMQPIANYQPGDVVRYGNAYYYPEASGSSRLVVLDGKGNKHYAEIWRGNLFYCS